MVTEAAIKLILKNSDNLHCKVLSMRSAHVQSTVPEVDGQEVICYRRNIAWYRSFFRPSSRPSYHDQFLSHNFESAPSTFTLQR